MDYPLEFIRRLPKTDLHCHLDGSMRIETLLDLAERQGVRLPAETPDALRPHLMPPATGGPA